MKRLLLLLLSSLLLSQAQTYEKKVYPSGLDFGDGTKDFTFIVRYPANYEEVKSKGGWQPVIILTTHLGYSALGKIERILKDEPANNKALFDSSDRYGLPIVTYNTPRPHPKKRYYLKGENDWEANPDKHAPIYANLQTLASTWFGLFDQFCDEKGLQKEDLVGYGLSNGGQWISRIAMLYPERFYSIDVGIPGCCPTPVEGAKNIHWLHISGGLDGGYGACNRFYEKTQKMGFTRLTYLSPQNLGHGKWGNHEKMLKYRALFYEYILAEGKRTTDQKKLFVGDYVNNIVVHHTKADWIPKNQRVLLLNSEMARAWGKLENNF